MNNYLPYDEDLINNDSSFWDIEEEAAPIPNDLWASGLGKMSPLFLHLIYHSIVFDFYCYYITVSTDNQNS